MLPLSTWAKGVKGFLVPWLIGVEIEMGFSNFASPTLTIFFNSYPMRSLFRLNKYFYKYRGRLVAGVLFVAISNLFGIIPARLIREAMDDSAATIDIYRSTTNTLQQSALMEEISKQLLWFAFMVIGLALLKGLFMFFMRQTIIVISRHIEYDMKNEIFQHYQTLDQPFYSVNNTGDLMNRISEDVSRVRMYVGPALMYTVNMIVMFILVIWAMLRVNAELTFYTLLPLPVLALIIYYVEDIINRKSEKVQSRLSSLSTFVQEAFSGIRVLKAFSREVYSRGVFSEESDRYRAESLDLARVNALFLPALVMLIGLSTILTIFVGGLKVMSGEITMGNIAEFVIYVNMLLWPVAALGWVVSLVQRAAASQKRINEFLDTVPQVKPGNYSPDRMVGHIEFREVSFTYKNSGIRALDKVSFTIEPGTSLAVTGATGSGKSTLAQLLMRFIDPDSGQILVDGHDLKSYDLDAFRSHTGFVPQEVFLFSDTIAGNIAFGIQNGTGNQQEEAIRRAAREAAILDNILEFPEGFQTRVGERGITLSGGQKQRISIARAIIRRPEILIFDDCLSAVDTITEEEILSNLSEIMKGKSTLIVSHRISTVKNADQILVLAGGKVAESGTHDRLLEAGGLYQQMYESQMVEMD